MQKRKKERMEQKICTSKTRREAIKIPVPTTKKKETNNDEEDELDKKIGEIIKKEREEGG